MSRLHLFVAALFVAVTVSTASADVAPGIVFDFESESTDGWAGGASPTIQTDGGPDGAGDAFLQVGNGGNWAVFNTGLSGVLDPAATTIEVDFNRPLGQPAMDLRVVLFGPGTGNRWTSSSAMVVPGDGAWETYTFSLLEDDLTQVQGSQSYASLVGDLNRLMFRHDSGTPSARGEAIAGTLGLDNIRVLGASADVPGDVNGDGSVDLLDLDTLGENFGALDAARAQGDLTGDGVIDQADLDQLSDNYGVSAAVAVPEPTAGVLALLAVAARRRSARRV